MVSFVPQPLQPLEKEWGMGGLQCKNALTQRCVTMSSELVQYFITMSSELVQYFITMSSELVQYFITMSSELVQYFTNWVDNFSHCKIQTNKCRYRHTNHSVMAYCEQGIAITRFLDTAGSPSGTCGEQSGAGAG